MASSTPILLITSITPVFAQGPGEGLPADTPPPAMEPDQPLDVTINAVGEDAIALRWTTPDATPTQVRYGLAPDQLTQLAYDARGPEVLDTHHEIVVQGLQSHTVYYFAVGSGQELAPEAASVFKVRTGGGSADEAQPNALAEPQATAGYNRIGIEAGHSSTDSGSMSCGGQYKEAENTFAIANMAAALLRDRGFTVDVFRGGDQAMRGYRADAFVSLHNDYCAGSNSGFKVSRYGGIAGQGTNGSGDASDRLVQNLWTRYGMTTGLSEDRSTGHFTNNMRYYYALSWIAGETPGAIIEMAWWSGDEDRLLRQRGNLAAGVAESILAFLGRSDGDDTRSISNGQTLNGRIDPANDEDTTYFNGSAGQAVTLRMNKVVNGLDSYLYLYAPNGDLVTYDDDGGGNLNSLIDQARLPQNGRYRIAARSWSRSSSGAYTLSMGAQNTSCPAYRAEYYNNRYLSGAPAFTRCEVWPIRQDWGTGSPGSGVGSDNFSVRWTGRAHIDSGNFTFIARADDGIRVWLGSSLIIDAWRDQSPTEYRVSRAVSGGDHDVRVEYYENGGGAVAEFRWEQASPGGNPNLARNRTAYATSQESSSYPPGRGNDGSMSTCWSSRISSSLGDQWWWVDLGGRTDLAEVVVRWEAAYASRYFIGWSDDARTFNGYWFTISQPGAYRYRLGTRSGRYVGILMRERAPRMNNYSFWEFEVYRQSTALAQDAATGALTGPLTTIDVPANSEPEVMEFDPDRASERLWLPFVAR